MALALAVQTFGKRDGLGFRASDLIPNFAAFTGRAERTEDHIAAMVDSLLLHGQEQNILYRKDKITNLPIPISGHTRILAADRITQNCMTGTRINPDGTETTVQYSPENPFIIYGTYKQCSEFEAIFHTFVENDGDARRVMTDLDIAFFVRFVGETHGISDAEIAKRLGKKPSTISNCRKFLDLDRKSQMLLSTGKINSAIALTLVDIAEADRPAAIEAATAAVGVGKPLTASAVKRAAVSGGARTTRAFTVRSVNDFRTAMRLKIAVTEDPFLKAVYESLADGFWNGTDTADETTNLIDNLVVDPAN